MPQLLQRLHALPAPARRRRRSRAGAAGDRARNARAGRNRALPAQLSLAAAGLALAVYGASKIPLSAFEAGIAQAAPADKILVSVFLEGGVDALSVWPRSATRATPSCDRTWRLAPKRRAELHRGPELQLAPLGGRAGDPARRGQSQRLPGDRLRTPRPVALHLEPLLRDRRARRQLPHRLAGPLHRHVGDDDNPLQALSMDGGALADDRDRRTARRGDRQRRRLRTLVAGQRTGQQRDVKSFAALRLAALGLPGARTGAKATTQTDKLRTNSVGSANSASPVDLPGNRLRPQARRARRLHRRRAADARRDHPRRGGYDTHAGEAEDLERGLKETSEGLLAFQRDLEARGLADRVLVEMWSEFGRRPEENALAGTDHGAAGGAFVDRLEGQGRDGRRVPRPLHPRRRAKTSGSPATFGRCTAAARAVAGQDAEPIIPGAAGFPRPTLVEA